MRDTPGEVRKNPLVMFSCGPIYMDEQRHDDQREPIYSNSVPIRDVALVIYRKQWTIETGSDGTI